MAKRLFCKNLIRSAEWKKNTLFSVIWGMIIFILTVHDISSSSTATMYWSIKYSFESILFLQEVYVNEKAEPLDFIFCQENKYIKVFPHILVDLRGSNTARSLLVHLFCQLMDNKFNRKYLMKASWTIPGLLRLTQNNSNLS